MDQPTGQELKQWLHLLGCGFDRARFSELLRDLTGPEELLGLSDAELSGQFGLSPAQIAALRKPPDMATIDRQMRAMERLSIELVPAHDPRFPVNLFRMRQHPPAIFLKGKLEPIDELAVGIVGPRNATPYGTKVARHLARELAPTVTIVSGAAAGIDSVAHEAALDAGGRTIAVLGCGIDVDYPATNAKLRERIGSGGAGALLSIFPPGTQPHRHNFPQRNYVLAGLSLAVVIAEAATKSGALVTARAAADEGRAVYAVPGDITRPNSEGSNQLLRDGAAVCTKPADILADLEFELRARLMDLRMERGATDAPPPPPTPARIDDPLQRVLFEAIRHHPVSHDDLIERFVPDRMSIGDLSSALLMLEMENRIEQMPGRLYAPRL